MLPVGCASTDGHACMKISPSMSKILGAAGPPAGRMVVVTNTRAACMPDVMTRLMLQEVPQLFTCSKALLMNRDRSTRAARTTSAALKSPTCSERTTALISMKAESLLAVSLLLQRPHVITKSPSLGRAFAVVTAKAGAMDLS